MGDQSPVAVVSWSFWKSRFDLDPGIIGKKIVVNDDAPVAIIGVTQRGFYGLSEHARQDVWWPITLGSSQGFGLLGRLKPGVSKEQARAEMATLFKSAVDRPDANPFMRQMELRIEPAGSGGSTPLSHKASTPREVLMATGRRILLLTFRKLTE